MGQYPNQAKYPVRHIGEFTTADDSWFKYVHQKLNEISGGSALRVKCISGSPTVDNVSEIWFNNIDEVVYDLGPGMNGGQIAGINISAAPSLLASPFILGGTTLYTGRESENNINHEGVAGDIDNYMTYDTTLSLDIPSFGYASVGVLKLYINTVQVAEIDLGGNFMELNRNTGQNVTPDYIVDSGSYTLTNGICPFIGVYTGMGDMRINHVDPSAGIDTDDYQEGSITINISDENFFRQGYNYIELTHEGIAPGLQSANFKIFDDKNPYLNPQHPNITIPNLTETLLVPKWVSGVQYYGENSTFGLNFVANNAFDNVYHVSNAPVTFDDDGVADWGVVNTPVLYTHASVSGVTNPPTIGNVMSVTNYTITVPADQDENDGRVRITPRDPYGSYTSVDTPSNNYQINSWGVESDATHEYFRDENYRFPANTNFDVVPANLTGNWDSTISLSSGTPGYTTNLQVYDTDNATANRLIHPITDFSVRNPAPNPDYTGEASGTNYVYYRIYQGVIDNSNGVLEIPGITDADLISGDVKIEIKVPSKTVWLDCWVDYIFGTFPTQAVYPTGTDGTGCRINPGVHSPNLDGSIGFTLGPFSSDSSVDRVLFVRVTYINQLTGEINGTGPGFSISDW